MKARVCLIFAIIIAFISTTAIVFMGLNLAGTASMLKNSISVTSMTYTKEYDGLGADASKYELSSGELFSGHHLDVTFTSSGTDVGTYNNYFEVKVLNRWNKDVSEQYDITTYAGTYTITQRKITLYVNVPKSEYDGTELKPQKEHCSILDGSLVEGHTLDVILGGSITEIGEEPITVIPHVYDGDMDVTKNYSISSNEGVLVKTPIALTVTSHSLLNEVYDGKEHKDTHTEPYDVIGKLAPGDTIEYTSLVSLTEVGTITNNFDLKIVNSNGDNVTDYYTITKNYGVINVKKKRVEYTSCDYETTYTGSSIDLTGHKLQAGTSPAETDDLLISFNTSYVNAGTYDNYFTVRMVSKSDITLDVTKNYDVVINYGTIDILKREVSIATASGSKVYDGSIDTGWTDVNGNPILAKSYEILQSNLVTGHILQVEYTNITPYAGETVNSVSVKVLDSLHDNINVSKNYDITVIAGTLTVLKREISIKASSATKAYDGAPLESSQWYLLSGTTAPNEYLEVSVTGSRTEVGQSENVISYRIVDGLGNVISYASNNYKVTAKSGILNVYSETKQVTIWPKDRVMSNALFISSGLTELKAEEILGFEEYKNQGYVIDMSSITFDGAVSSIGTVESTILYPENIKVTQNGKDVSAQFEFTIQTGILQIYGATVEITSHSQTKVYDGTEISDSALAVADVHVTDVVGLPALTMDNENSQFTIEVDDDVILVKYTFTGSQTAVGQGLNTFTVQGVFVNGSSVNQLADFNIVYTYGKLTVTHATLNVVTKGKVAKVSEGSVSASQLGTDVIVTGLIGSDKAEVKTPCVLESNTPTSCDNAVVIVVKRENPETHIWEDVTDNYIILYTYGKLELVP